MSTKTETATNRMNTHIHALGAHKSTLRKNNDTYSDDLGLSVITKPRHPQRVVLHVAKSCCLYHIPGIYSILYHA